MSAASRGVRHARLKLLALIAIFVLPLLVAWVMVVWRVGIPEGRIAHGELAPEIPLLAEWPLDAPVSPVVGDWVLAFDCEVPCEDARDQWWRLHRALGREAPRVTRLRIGGPEERLPGEVVAYWRSAPDWRQPNRVWVLDPAGQPVLAYAGEADARGILDDLSRLLRMNPER